MLKQNEDLPEIEKLGRHEFDLDIEEQNKLQAEADSEVQRVNLKYYFFPFHLKWELLVLPHILLFLFRRQKCSQLQIMVNIYNGVFLKYSCK